MSLVTRRESDLAGSFELASSYRPGVSEKAMGFDMVYSRTLTRHICFYQNRFGFDSAKWIILLTGWYLRCFCLGVEDTQNVNKN